MEKKKKEEEDLGLKKQERKQQEFVKEARLQQTSPEELGFLERETVLEAGIDVEFQEAKISFSYN